MTTEMQDRETESLGQFLKHTRIDRGLDLEQIAEDTRISASNLRAMEADEYSALPADAFSRGFYILYAKTLQLDPESIVARYRSERGLHPRKGAVVKHNPPAHKAAQQLSNMAEPSAVSPLSTIGYIVLLLIILAGGLCWYFNINPATYISEKLRAFQGEESTITVPAEENGDSKQPAAPPSGGQGANPVSSKAHIDHLAAARQQPAVLDQHRKAPTGRRYAQPQDTLHQS